MSITVKDASGSNQTVETLPAVGQAAAAASLPVVIASDQSAIPVKGTPVTLTDRSTTVTSGGVAENACASNASRKFLHISNPSRTLEFWYSTTGTAASEGAGSTYVGPGAAFIFDQMVPTGAVSIFSATTAAPYTVKEA